MAGSFDYDRMQKTAAGLLGRFKQGQVSLRRTTITPAPNEWTSGGETVETWPLKAAVKRLHQRYENGVLIIETGDLVTFAVPEVEPMVTDHLIIDGVERVITNLTRIPAAGTIVCWKAWCAT